MPLRAVQLIELVLEFRRDRPLPLDLLVLFLDRRLHALGNIAERAQDGRAPTGSR